MTQLILEDYQIKIVQEMVARKSRIFSVDTGLGKTICILTAALYFLERDNAQRQLVLTKATIIRHGFRHDNDRFNIHPNMIYKDYPTTHQPGLWVMSYDYFRYHWDEIKTWEWDVVYLDESHSIANRGTEIAHCINGDWRGVGCLRRKRTYLFTGTLMPNRPEQVFSQLRAAGYPGTWTAFKDRFFIAPVAKMPWIVKLNPRKKQEFLDELAKWTYRVTKDEVKDVVPLAEKRYERVQFALLPDEKREHDLARKDGVYHNEVLANSLVRILRCRQITSGAVQRATKFEELVGRIRDETHKIVFYAFGDEWPEICETVWKIGQEPTYVINGRVSAATKEKRINQWKETGGWLVAQFSTCKNGLTLVEAESIVYYSLEDNNESYTQSQDRIHRRGQTADVVTYYVLCADGTVDEAILTSLAAKKNISEELKRWVRRTVA